MDITSLVSGVLIMPGIVGALMVRKELCSIDISELSERIRARLQGDILKGETLKTATRLTGKLFGKMRAKSKAYKVDHEIFNGLGYLRNRIMSSDVSKINTDNMIEELLINADVLRPAYLNMLSFVRVDDRKRAAEVFNEMAHSDNSREYARILIQLDEMAPEEMYDSLRAFQKTIGESKVTRLKKRDEAVSDLLYLPVVLNLVIIFFNFIYIAYFIQQKDMLKMLM